MVQGNEMEEIVQVVLSSKRNKERAKDARGKRRRETEGDSSRGSVSIVEETTP